MRVLFDARPGTTCLTGIGRYARTVAGLLQAGVPGHDCWALGGEQPRLVLSAQSRVEEELELPALLEREGIDLLHSPLFHQPAVLPTLGVVTIHDAIPLARPALATDGFRHLFSQAEEAATRADAVVCPSRSAKSDLVELMGLPADKVHVVPETPAPQFHRVDPKAAASVRTQHDLDRDFLLVVGSLETRKNPGVVLEALSRIPETRRPLAVFVGPPAGLDLEAEASRLHLESSVRYLGPVPDTELVALYSEAFALVFPSLYEGFGLPVVEAFATDTPVIASQAASLPEVVGDAGLLFDPEDPGLLAERMRELRETPSLSAELARRGRERLRHHYSPCAVRRCLADLYSSLERGRP